MTLLHAGAFRTSRLHGDLFRANAESLEKNCRQTYFKL